MLALLFLLANVLPFRAEGEKIYWGREAKPHSWPYMAIVLSYENNETITCGGFLIEDDIVMTAAHCHRRKMDVILGAHDISKRETTQQYIPVIKSRMHKDFNENSLVNDIMLLKLKFKAQLNGTVSTITLPRSDDWVKPRQVCSTAGWGKMADGRYPVKLQEVGLEVQPEQKCKERFSKTYNSTIELCVGNPDDIKAIGSGDSGGPLICNRVAHGIASYGDENNKPPQVFTRISSFGPWIHRTMKLF